jgi:hypothetical protein
MCDRNIAYYICAWNVCVNKNGQKKKKKKKKDAHTQTFFAILWLMCMYFYINLSYHNQNKFAHTNTYAEN